MAFQIPPGCEKHSGVTFAVENGRNVWRAMPCCGARHLVELEDGSRIFLPPVSVGPPAFVPVVLVDEEE